MSTPVSVSGTGHQRGQALGEIMRDRIRDVVGAVVDSLGGPAEVQRFVTDTSFEAAIATYTPDLLAEFDAMATSSGVPRDHLLAHNLMDEHWWWQQTGATREACSTLAIAVEPPLLGQTMDLDRVLDGSQVVLRSTDESGRTTAVLTSAGLMGLCGLSSAGFGICVNALTTLEHSATGLPVAFVLRGALAQPDARAALAFLQSVPHASGQHYAIVSHDAHGGLFTASVECSAFGAVVSAPANRGFGHANHPLATTDIDPTMAPGQSRSHLRQGVLDAHVAETLDDLADLLSSPPLCVSRTDSDWFTFGALAMRLGDELTLRYSLGPPDAEPWHEIVVSRN